MNTANIMYQLVKLSMHAIIRIWSVNCYVYAHCYVVIL